MKIEELDSMSSLEWLQQYYKDCCDGYWEHSYGVTIDTLDNPGWDLKIDLADTPLENINFDEVKIETSESDWVACRIEHGQFKAAGGPLNLGQLIEIFRHWAESNS